MRHVLLGSITFASQSDLQRDLERFGVMIVAAVMLIGIVLLLRSTLRYSRNSRALKNFSQWMDEASALRGKLFRTLGEMGNPESLQQRYQELFERHRTLTNASGQAAKEWKEQSDWTQLAKQSHELLQDWKAFGRLMLEASDVPA